MISQFKADIHICPVVVINPQNTAKSGIEQEEWSIIDTLKTSNTKIASILEQSSGTLNTSANFKPQQIDNEIGSGLMKPGAHSLLLHLINSINYNRMLQTLSM